MSLAVLSLVSAISGGILIILIFGLLYIQDGEPYLGTWTLAWCCSLVGLGSFLGITINRLSLSFFALYAISILLSSYFLLRATYENFGIRMPKYWKYGTFIVSIWFLISGLWGFPSLVIEFPWSALLGALLIYNGFMFLRHDNSKATGSAVAGCCYILWGVHSIDFLFLQSFSWLVPWGFLFGTTLALGVAIGSLAYYFEKKNLINITRHKQIEEELKYLSFHDGLTGLFNLTYFEQEIKRRERENRINKENNEKTGIVICDVDGLKLVNDTLGHERGDTLLIEAGRIIQSVFSETDLVARIGGDEFAVLLKTTEEGVERAYRNIREALRRYNANSPELPLSISVGFAVSRVSHDLTQVFKEADNNMYREKLRRSQGVRDSFVGSLMKALDDKDFTRCHTDHLQKLMLLIADAIGLPETAKADLCLFTRYHDIGKVGVTDEILFKPGLLDAVEKEKVVRHCEIGYRIAQAASELSSIADWILKHHEWWNGEGYPLGLKGEEIPIECRILAIADAYDAMINFRPYNRMVSQDQAIAELKKWAGIQFDPKLTHLFCEIVTNLVE